MGRLEGLERGARGSVESKKLISAMNDHGLSVDFLMSTKLSKMAIFNRGQPYVSFQQYSIHTGTVWMYGVQCWCGRVVQDECVFEYFRIRAEGVSR